jgi:hypothetical protein
LAASTEEQQKNLPPAGEEINRVEDNENKQTEASQAQSIETAVESTKPQER